MTARVNYRANGAGETRLIGRGGDYVTAKATSAETGGEYTVFEVAGSPGFGPPLHAHDWQEFFYVLEGEVEFTYVEEADVRSVRAHPGDSFTVQPRAPHAFRNPTDRPNRFLVVDTPVGIERLFLDHGAPVAAPGEDPAEEPLDLARMGEILPALGIEIVAATPLNS